jgi:hypothetical protein
MEASVMQRDRNTVVPPLPQWTVAVKRAPIMPPKGVPGAPGPGVRMPGPPTTSEKNTAIEAALFDSSPSWVTEPIATARTAPPALKLAPASELIWLSG